MPTLPRFTVAALAGAALLLAAVAPGVHAQDADGAEVKRYVLTEAGLAKYSQAHRNLAALPAGRTGSCDDDSGDSPTSISGMVAKLDATPGAKAAVQSSGMTTREYVVFSMSLLQNGLAAWALDQPGGKLPAGVSKSNVDFVKKHDAELKRLGEVGRKNDCGGDAAGEEDDADA